MNEIILNVNNFNLKYTLECGQCFRWNKVFEDKNEICYIGVIKDRVIKITMKENIIIIKSSNMENLENIIKEYFDLNVDYGTIEKNISKIDSNVTFALKNSSGIRILNQSFFETVISYIISANNNIPRISKSINEISRRYGKKVIFEDKEYYLFPNIYELKEVTEEEFKSCGVGFRARYLKNTIKYMLDEDITFDSMMAMDTTGARDTLLKMQGVGQKVADCILLFSLSRKEVFPIDVWVERVMARLYFKELNGHVSKKDIQKYSEENFGEYAGIVQQHLFYNVREKLI